MQAQLAGGSWCCVPRDEVEVNMSGYKITHHMRKLSALLGLLVLVTLPAPSWAAVTPDNSAVSPTEFGEPGIGATSIGINQPFSIAISGSNTAAILCLWMGNNNATNISMTIGGVAATAIPAIPGFPVADTGTAIEPRMVCLGAKGIPTGTQPVTATWENPVISASLGVVSANGVDQDFPFNNPNNATTAWGPDVSLTITSASGDMTSTAAGITSGGTELVTNRTRQYINEQMINAGDTGPEPGTGTTTHIWTREANDGYVAAGANFRAASGVAPWAGILGSSRAIDWSTAGVEGGIPNRTTICVTTECNIVSAGAVTVDSINAAISSALDNTVVSIPQGTFTLAGMISPKSRVTVRGAGPLLTKLVFASGASCNGPSAQVCFGGSFNWSGGPENPPPGAGGPTSWTTSPPGYAKGSTVLTLTSVANLQVGHLLILDQLNDVSDPGADAAFVCDAPYCHSSGNEGAQGRPDTTTANETLSQQEVKRVTAINGNNVTISPGLYMPNWRASQDPRAWWASTLIQGAGLEDLTLDYTPGGNFTNYGVMFFNAYNCWMKNVRSIYFNTTPGSQPSGRSHVHGQYSARITVRDSYFYGSRSVTTGNFSQSYGIETFIATGDWLVENNILQHIPAAILPNNGHGHVYAYNYSVDHYNANATWNSPGPTWPHSAGTGMQLFEGNQGTGAITDVIHGPHNLDTYFRNQWAGRDPGKTQQTVPFIAAAFNRNMNLVGNVLGEGNYTNLVYQAAVGGSSANCARAVYNLGWSGSQCGFDSAVGDDPLTVTTLMRWGNYDTFNDAVRWLCTEMPMGVTVLENRCPQATTLPPSFYRTSQPDWWVTPFSGNPPWPAVGPDVIGGNVTSGSGSASTLGGYAYKIPARLCYEHSQVDSVYGNNVKLFNASTCYPTP